MKTAWVVASVFSILTLFLAAAENKYGKKANEGLPYQKSGRMFRANKVNLVWEKAKKVGDNEMFSSYPPLKLVLLCFGKMCFYPLLIPNEYINWKSMQRGPDGRASSMLHIVRVGGM